MLKRPRCQGSQARNQVSNEAVNAYLTIGQQVVGEQQKDNEEQLLDNVGGNEKLYLVSEFQVQELKGIIFGIAI
jgi:hypothetical protein